MVWVQEDRTGHAAFEAAQAEFASYGEFFRFMHCSSTAFGACADADQPRDQGTSVVRARRAERLGESLLGNK